MAQLIPRNHLVVAVRLPDAPANTFTTLGARVVDSSLEFDVTEETTTDILGQIFTEIQNIVMSQEFEFPVQTAGPAREISDMVDAIVDARNFPALSGHEAIIIRAYKDVGGDAFAIKWDNSTLTPLSQGGAGEANQISHGVGVTFGGSPAFGTVPQYVPTDPSIPTVVPATFVFTAT